MAWLAVLREDYNCNVKLRNKFEIRLIRVQCTQTYELRSSRNFCVFAILRFSNIFLFANWWLNKAQFSSVEFFANYYAKSAQFSATVCKIETLLHLCNQMKMLKVCNKFFLTFMYNYEARSFTSFQKNYLKVKKYLLKILKMRLRSGNKIETDEQERSNNLKNVIRILKNVIRIFLNYVF